MASKTDTVMKLILLICLCALLSACSTFKPSALKYAELELNDKKRPLNYAVYTPPDWQAGERLPLMMFLHGGGGSHESFERYGGHLELDRLINSGKIARAIVVLPDGDNGFWENWADGTRSYRDWVLNELMPKIQNDYQTLECPTYCHIAGISMGGFGALRIAHFQPNTFSSVSAISAPIFTKKEERPSWLIRLFIPFKRIFGDVASARVRDNNPYYSWVDNRLDKKMRLQLVWGDKDHKGIVEGNQNFKIRLDQNQIPYQASVYEGGHKWKYWVSILDQVMLFSLGDPT